MVEATLPFAHWEGYYVIVGTSAAALTGLQFVIMALVAESNTKSGDNEIAAFGTPTVVHFAAVLLISAIVAAPWTTLRLPSYGLMGGAVAGLVYATIVTLRARRTTQYRPVMEDWIWHVVIPYIAYTLLLISAIAIPRREEALFGVAASALLLLFVGIHNAWDTVTYVALGKLDRRLDESDAPASIGAPEGSVAREG